MGSREKPAPTDDEEQTRSNNLTELQKQLKMAVDEILGRDDDNDKDDKDGDEEMRSDSTRKALDTLQALEDLHIEEKGKGKAKEEAAKIPDEFLCPISKEIMKDPVTLSTGHTYDRIFIEDQFNRGNRVCPQSKEALSDTTLTPNYLIKDLISKWSATHNINPPPHPSQDVTRRALVTDSDRKHLITLIDKLSHPSSTPLIQQKSAAKELRSLTKRITSYRSLFGHSPEHLDLILRPFLPGTVDGDAIDPELQTDLVTSIFNLSIDEGSKVLMCSKPNVLVFLVHSLDYGPDEAAGNASAALFSLSAIEDNKKIIVEAGASRQLLRRLDESDEHSCSLRDIGQAIYGLALTKKFRTRLVKEGLVRVILPKLKKKVMVDEFVSILAIFTNHHPALAQLVELQAMDCLLKVISEANHQRLVENAISIVSALCLFENSLLNEMDKDSAAFEIISLVSATGNARARRKADLILSKLKK